MLFHFLQYLVKNVKEKFVLLNLRLICLCTQVKCSQGNVAINNICVFTVRKRYGLLLDIYNYRTVVISKQLQDSVIFGEHTINERV